MLFVKNADVSIVKLVDPPVGEGFSLRVGNLGWVNFEFGVGVDLPDHLHFSFLVSLAIGAVA